MLKGSQHFDLLYNRHLRDKCEEEVGGPYVNLEMLVRAGAFQVGGDHGLTKRD
jgi:hypothetical protein